MTVSSLKLTHDDATRLINGGTLNPGYFLMQHIAPILAEGLSDWMRGGVGPMFPAAYFPAFDMPMPGEPGAFAAVAAGAYLSTGKSKIETEGCEPLLVEPRNKVRTVEVKRVRLKNVVQFSSMVTPDGGLVDVLIGVLVDPESKWRQVQLSLSHARMDPNNFSGSSRKDEEKANRIDDALWSWPGSNGGKNLIAITRARNQGPMFEGPVGCFPSITRRFPCADAPEGAATNGTEYILYPVGPDSPSLKGLTAAERIAMIEVYQLANDPQSLADKAMLRAREAAALA